MDVAIIELERSILRLEAISNRSQLSGNAGVEPAINVIFVNATTHRTHSSRASPQSKIQVLESSGAIDAYPSFLAPSGRTLQALKYLARTLMRFRLGSKCIWLIIVCRSSLHNLIETVFREPDPNLIMEGNEIRRCYVDSHLSLRTALQAGVPEQCITIL